MKIYDCVEGEMYEANFTHFVFDTGPALALYRRGHVPLILDQSSTPAPNKRYEIVEGDRESNDFNKITLPKNGIQPLPFYRPRIYARLEPTTDRNVSKFDVMKGKMDVQFYADKAATEKEGRMFWHDRSRPKKNTLKVTLADGERVLIWLPPLTVIAP